MSLAIESDFMESWLFFSRARALLIREQNPVLVILQSSKLLLTSSTLMSSYCVCVLLVKSCLWRNEMARPDGDSQCCDSFQTSLTTASTFTPPQDPGEPFDPLYTRRDEAGHGSTDCLCSHIKCRLMHLVRPDS